MFLLRASLVRFVYFRSKWVILLQNSQQKDERLFITLGRWCYW